MTDYISLHGHSCFSFLDGYSLPDQIIERVAELGQTAVAITDHGNVCAYPHLQAAARRHAQQRGTVHIIHPDLSTLLSTSLLYHLGVS
jgi:DNA polymerase III alpha subunit